MKEGPLRILVGADTDIDPNSGAAGTVYATNRALRELGHEVSEVWGKDLPHRIRHWNLHYLLELPRAYRDVVRRRTRDWPADVIQLSQPHAWLAARDHRRRRRHGVFVNRSHGLESMADAALLAWQRRLGIAPQRFPRAWVSARLREALHEHINRVVRYADGLIVPAEEIRDHLVHAHRADPSRIAVIHHGVPDEFIDTPRPELSGERLRRILNVGQCSPHKGPSLMAQAVSDALAAARELNFTWVCAQEHHARALALFDPEFHPRIEMRSWRSQNDLLQTLDEHGIFVSHAVYEGAAKASSEAMARGLAVVNTAVGAMREHAEGGLAARLVAVGDTAAMTDEILRLARSPEFSRRLGMQAAAVASKLRWRECASMSVNFYRELASC